MATLTYNNTFLVPAGYKATITPDADVIGGFYQPLNNPGEAPDPRVSLVAGEAVEVGPFNNPRFFGVKSTSGNIAKEVTFAGFADFSAEPSATVLGGDVVGESVTKEETVAVFKRTVLNLVDTPITVTDDPGVIQFGSAEIFNFPQGNLIILSAKAKGNLTGGVTGTLIDAFTGNIALGTTAAVAGATLATTQADILPSTAMATAASKVAAVDVAPNPTIPNSGARWLDGRSAAKKAFLNVKIADDATHTSGTAKFTGEVEIIWTVSEVEA